LTAATATVNLYIHLSLLIFKENHLCVLTCALGGKLWEGDGNRRGIKGMERKREKERKKAV
jgi:hypothetical protein